MKDCCKDEVEIRVKRQKLMIAVTLVAQGVPFLQSGQEFCRTKYGYHNTYNAPDNVNQIDWERKNRHNEVVEFTRDLSAAAQADPCVPLCQHRGNRESCPF
ncbi:MAG: hypothetical protein ACLVJ6_02780 [Merdibacter sp.]